MTTRACGYNEYFVDLKKARESTATLTAHEIVAINTLLPKGARVLCVGEAEVFDAEIDVVYHTVFDDCLLEQICRREGKCWPHDPWIEGESICDSQVIKRQFQQRKITHVLVNWTEIVRYRTSYGYSPFVTPELFDELVAIGVLREPMNLPFASVPIEGALLRELERFAPSLADRLRGTVITFQIYPVKR